jgi:hypothetical protein
MKNVLIMFSTCTCFSIFLKLNVYKIEVQLIYVSDLEDLYELTVPM